MYPFIFISIALHLVSFLCIVLLFLKQTKGTEVREEIAASMEVYIEQLEEENDRLLNEVKSYVDKRENQLDTRLRVLEQARAPEVEEPTKPDIVQHPSAHNERNQKAVQLHQQGFSVADIARILNCGIGEVELIVNLHGRSEQR
jgi:thioredoxin-like negative regulator of GroEL